MALFQRSHARSLLALGIAITALGAVTPEPVQAESRFWVTPTGGSFASTANWSTSAGGASGASVPVAADTANFTLNSTYTTTFSSNVTNTTLVVSEGTVTFDLVGLNYTLSGPNSVFVASGSGDTARLTVRRGTLGVDGGGDSVAVGIGPGNVGFLTISNQGHLGNGSILPSVILGATSGRGTLNVVEDGQIDVGLVTVGHSIDSIGALAVTGAHAVANTTILNVGQEGTGTINVSGGGTLATTGNATIGNLQGTGSNATVTGNASSWTISGNTTVGSNAEGSLSITAGGRVESTDEVRMGHFATGTGTATVTGSNSRWDQASSQIIGRFGVGSLTISSGGQVVASGATTLGEFDIGDGRATVTGVGSRWNLGGSLLVGSAGAGNVTVSAGGDLTAPDMTLGNAATGVGEVSVTGTGARLATTGAVSIANLGAGTLNVAAGGEVHVGTNFNLNNPAGAQTGTLNLNGGSIFVAGQFTNNGVFNFTDGLLQVKGNLQPNPSAVPFIINGADHDDQPTLDLFGAGTATNITSLIVGESRGGQLILRQGRVLDIGVNAISVGAAVGGEGAISVSGGAQLNSTGFLSIGGMGLTPAGRGTLNIAGGTVNIGALRIFSDGTVNLDGGTLAVDSTPVLDGQFNWASGTLRFEAAANLTSANAPRLLGLAGTLRAGQELASTAPTALTVQTPVVVDGGTLSLGQLNNQSTIEVRSGAASVAGTTTNSAGAHLFVERTLSAGGALTNASGARLELAGGAARLQGAGAVQNNGLILGHGTIANAVTNNATGTIRVDAGKSLFFSGAFAANAGELSLQGGTLDINAAVTNAIGGTIAGRGTLVTAGGLTNRGDIALSSGISDVFGDVNNAAGGRVTISGNADVTFWDDVTNGGALFRVSAGSSATFFGAFSGAGASGSGSVYLEADITPGFSPGTMAFGGDVSLGPLTSLVIEIGGATPGTQHDQVTIEGSAFLDGTLEISTIDGFSPTLPGQRFTIVAAEEITGEFSNITGAPSARLPGLFWSVEYTESRALLSVGALPGDIDLDGTVDRADAALFAQFFGRESGSTWATGDFDEDGATTLEDWGRLQSHLGQSVPAQSASALPAAVPEPSSLFLSFCGVSLPFVLSRTRRFVVATWVLGQFR